MTDSNMDDLKQLIAQTLESNGVLANIRAQLRAHVFKAIEQQESNINTGNSSNHSRTTDIQSSDADLLLFDLISEYLEYYEFEYTGSLLTTESNLPNNINRRNRVQLADQLGLQGYNKKPLLFELVQNRSNKPSAASNPINPATGPTHSTVTVPPPRKGLTPLNKQQQQQQPSIAAAASIAESSESSNEMDQSSSAAGVGRRGAVRRRPDIEDNETNNTNTATPSSIASTIAPAATPAPIASTSTSGSSLSSLGGLPSLSGGSKLGALPKLGATQSNTVQPAAPATTTTVSSPPPRPQRLNQSDKAQLTAAVSASPSGLDSSIDLDLSGDDRLAENRIAEIDRKMAEIEATKRQAAVSAAPAPVSGTSAVDTSSDNYTEDDFGSVNASMDLSQGNSRSKPATTASNNPVNTSIDMVEDISEDLEIEINDEEEF